MAISSSRMIFLKIESCAWIWDLGHKLEEEVVTGLIFEAMGLFEIYEFDKEWCGEVVAKEKQA